MRKKKNTNQQQFSLFDILPDHVEKLQKENEKEEQYSKSLLLFTEQSINKEQKNEHREQHGSRTHSNAGIGQENIQHDGRVASISERVRPETDRQMGNEQSREVKGTGEERERRGTSEQILGTTANGGRSEELGGILRPFASGTQPLGNISDDGNSHRIIENYIITESDNVGIGTPKQKYQDNINALKVLEKLRKEKATSATKEEQAILVKYVGWGGLPQAFDESNESWKSEYNELKALLSESDYNNARRSTQDAHFTPKNVIDTMYQGLQQFGVKEKVKVLEPSAGIGNFIGFKPQEFQADFVAVEQDTISADILSYLYPEELKVNLSFQDTRFKSPIFDITIGNPPYGQLSLFDRNFPQLENFSIHNYFIAKSMELVKDGGIGAFVVSRHFMDSMTAKHREFIAENSHFLGAIRLPNSTFKENALTEVTTDIVFFQKKTELEKEQNISKGYANWINADTQSFTNIKSDVEQSGNINSYFVENPDQVLGKLEFGHGRFDSELHCVGGSSDLSLAMTNALKALPKNIFDNAITHQKTLAEPTYTALEEKLVNSEQFKKLKNNSYIDGINNNKIYVKVENELGEYTCKPVDVSDKDAQRIKGMIKIRDTVRTLFELEKSPTADEREIARWRERLNISYDNFQKKFGYLNSQKNRSVFGDDPESTLIQSLEVKYDRGISKKTAQEHGVEAREASAKKADIFSKRVFYFKEPAKSANSAQEALLISLRERGTIDFERMGELLSKSEDVVKQELNGTLIFENPINKKWEIKDKYLTGNIRKKLEEAKRIAEKNPEYMVNVQALEKAMPPEIEPADIGFRFGSTWIPDTDVKQFVEEVIGSLSFHKNEITYTPITGSWTVNIDIYNNVKKNFVWGTEDYPANKIIKSLLENTPIQVLVDTGEKDDKGKPIKAIDAEKTAAAMEKANKVQDAFKEWLWQNEERRTRLAKLYNEKFNTHVPVQYDGSHIELAGASHGIELNPHQKNVIWRSIQEGTALFDHVVGAGKTYEAIATAMESKRLGFVKKPMIVVPNHLLYQWRDEFYKLYPDANILVADKKDLFTENRERFFGKIATNDWDAVIIAHSSFKKIEMPQAYREQFYEEEIENLSIALENARLNGEDNKLTIKQLERTKERTLERMKKLNEKNGGSKSVDFSDLGVDALFVDEAHEFKNLQITTSLNVSGLGNLAGSEKASDMYMKCRYLQEKQNSKGVYFLTGTPISNTIAEVYTMQRYLQHDELEEKGILSFDAWASTFGKITTNWELDATGVNYKLKSRFASFDNVPELLSMYRTFADVVTRSDLEEQAKQKGERIATPPLLENKPINVIVERSDEQEIYMNDIIYRMEHLPKNPRIDNPLKITNDARKAGLDYRLIDPYAEDFENSKVNTCASKVYDIWEKSKDDKGTQLVFCDLSTPKGTTKSNLEATPKSEENDNENEEKKELSMDEILSVGTNFSVYNDMKEKLIRKGIPAKEIAFIHDANTDLQKQKLFDDVKCGRVRVLIGSTFKMGSGMNVQERLVAAHHLDAPWRPSDLEQRNGRIIRQGNELYKKDPDNFKIEIYNYATKQTYDARMWQTIEYKASAIEQFRKGDVLSRSIDDVQSEAANAAEMKAAASGNPLILLEVTYKAEKQKLEANYSQFLKSQHNLDKRISYLEKADERFDFIKDKYTKAMGLRDKNSIEPDFYIDGKALQGEEGLKKLDETVKKAVKETQILFTSKPKIGTYRGFDVFIQNAPDGNEKGYKFTLSTPDGFEFKPKNLGYLIKDEINYRGLFTRMDNFLNKGIDDEYATYQKVYEDEKKEFLTAKSSQSGVFEQMDELEVAKRNHNAVLRELNFMQKDKNYIPNFKPLTLEGLKLERLKEEKTLLEYGNVNQEKSQGMAL